MLKRILFCFFLISFTSTTAMASLPISTRTKVSCMLDYYRYCENWPKDDLRKCFQKNVFNVSDSCVESLIDDYLITRKEVEDMKKMTSGSQKKTKKTVKKEIKPVALKKKSSNFDIWKKNNGF